MANVIAANCRGFKLNDAPENRHAIHHYEIDLAHLKASFYRPGASPWPEHE